MKKILLTVIAAMMMLSFNVKAEPSAAGLTIQPWAGPAVIMLAAMQVEYKACNDLPYRTVSFKSGSNHLFSVSECDYQKNKDSYK